MYFRLSRCTIRKSAVARPRTTPTRRRASNAGSDHKLSSSGTPEPKGLTNTSLIIGGLLAAGGVAGYYFLSQERVAEDNVARKTRELDHALRAQASGKIDEGKQKIQQIQSETKSKITSSIDQAAIAANATMADAQSHLASAKNSAEQSLRHTREEAEKRIREAEHYADKKAQAANRSWWSWLGWSK